MIRCRRDRSLVLLPPEPGYGLRSLSPVRFSAAPGKNPAPPAGTARGPSDGGSEAASHSLPRDRGPLTPMAGQTHPLSAHLMTMDNLFDPLGTPPQAGGGVHRWIFVSARKLARFGVTPEEAYRLIRKAVASCGRPVPDREIWDAIGGAGGPSPDFPGASKWPKSDPLAIEAIARENPAALERLYQASRHHDLRAGHPARFVASLMERLFPGNPVICTGEGIETMACHRLRDCADHLHLNQYVVPSPMRGFTGITLTGRTSRRCLDNTGPRRFLVIEFDTGSIQQQAALHLHLALRYPLTLVVHSGGKSLHGWYFVEGTPDLDVENFMRYAVGLGADPHTWTACQPVRMPGGLRSGAVPVLQTVLFYNPTYDSPR